MIDNRLQTHAFFPGFYEQPDVFVNRHTFMANLGHSALKPEESAVSNSQRESLAIGQDELHSPTSLSLQPENNLSDAADQQLTDSALSSVQSFLQDISRAFDCLRRYYVDSFLPSRTPRKTSISPRTSNSFSAEALVLLCEDFDMCPHPFPPSFICKVHSSLTSVSVSPVDLLARSLAVLACSGFRYRGIPGKTLSEAEAFVALLQHMHYSQGPSRLHTALGLGTAPRPMFRVPSPSYDGKNEKLYFVECLPMLMPHSAADYDKNIPFRAMIENGSFIGGSSSGFPARGLMKANQVAVASRTSRLIKLYREENSIELTGAPVLTQKSSDFERGVDDLFEFSRNKELKVSEMRWKKQQAELMQCNFAPQICAKSDHIAGELHRVGTVEDRLLAEGRLSEAKVVAARMMQSRAVLVHAQRRPLSAPVRSRPVSAPSEYVAPDSHHPAANNACAPPSSARKPDANQTHESHNFKPSILPASKRLHRSVRVEYALTAWGEARNAKWEAIRAQEEFKSLQLANRPSSAGGTRRTISADVALTQGTNENSRDRLSSFRLHSPDTVVVPQSVKSRTEKVVKDLKLEAPSFQPNVDKMSRKIDAQRHRDNQSQNSRFEELYSIRIQQNLRKKALVQEQEEKAARSCTFVPDTRETKGMTKRLISTSAVSNNVAESIILRGLERRSKTEDRMEMIRMVQAEEELLECTFRPSIAGSFPNSKVSTRATTPVAAASAREESNSLSLSSKKLQSEKGSYTKAHIFRSVSRKEPSVQLNIEKRIQNRHDRNGSSQSLPVHTPKTEEVAPAAILDVTTSTPGPRQTLQFNTPRVPSGQSSRTHDHEAASSSRIKEDAIQAIKEAKSILEASLSGKKKASLSTAVATYGGNTLSSARGKKSGFSIDNPHTWSAVDVKIWLEAVGAKQAVPPFTLHGVDGARLLSVCSDQHLKALSVSNDQLRLKLLRAIAALKESTDVSLLF